MPLQMKVQPLDAMVAVRSDPAKQAGKSRLKRLFERQFQRISSAEKLAGGGGGDGKDGGELEPSSVCLDRMVLSFIEESNEKAARYGRRRCNCFNGNSDDSSDEDADFRIAGDAPSTVSAAEILKGLVPCVSIVERNLLADAAKIVEKGMIIKGKDECRRIVADGLRSLGYDASICKSHWEKTPSIPAGEYEYVDVVIADGGGERLLVDVDFRSEFEIARSTKNYRAVLQSLPSIFVGKADRLKQIVAVVAEAAKQSLRKKGLHFPPWRKPEYLRAKWLSPYHRIPIAAMVSNEEREGDDQIAVGEGKSESGDGAAPSPISAVSFSGELEMRAAAAEKITVVVVSPWQPPAVKPKAAQPGARVVTAGLASALREKL